jgi:hypothetical protein
MIWYRIRHCPYGFRFEIVRVDGHYKVALIRLIDYIGGEHEVPDTLVRLYGVKIT